MLSTFMPKTARSHCAMEKPFPFKPAPGLLDPCGCRFCKYEAGPDVIQIHQ